MLKRYSLITGVFLFSLSLALTISGCGPTVSYNDTTFNGTPVTCKQTFNPIDLNPVDSLPTCTPITPTHCPAHFIYDNLIDKGQSWKVIDHEVNQNNSSTPAQVTFSSNTSTTVTVTDELGVTVSEKGSIGVIEASVQAQINLSVSVSVAVTIGNQDTFTIPPGQTAYANYGVKVQITSGHFYNKAPCSGEKSDWGTDITYVPIATGWCVWTSDQPPCPSI